MSVHPVAAAYYGCRLVANSANHFATVVITAGSRGCWFAINWEHARAPVADILSTVRRTYASATARAAAFTLAAGVAPGVTSTTLPAQSLDTRKTMQTVVLAGGTTTALNATNDLPVYDQRDVSDAASGFMHFGNLRNAPRQWLDPNRVFVMQAASNNTALVTHTIYLVISIEEDLRSSRRRG